MKKIFGIAIALALVLSVTVIPSPAAAAGTITCLSVTPTNPITGQLSDYTISFITQEPLEPDIVMGTLWGEYIDVSFPPGTGLAFIATSDVVVRGTDSLMAPVAYSWIMSQPGTTLGVTPWILGNTLRIYLDFLAGPPNDLLAGPITVEIYDIVENGPPCNQTLCVGTTAETCTNCPSYIIYLYEWNLCPFWNLISIPGIPVDPDIEVVLADLIAKKVIDPTFEFKVYYYDCTTWYAYNNGSYASLTEMNECAAYWIWVNKAASFKVHGNWYPPPPGPPLKKCYHECWNMVGFTSDVDRGPFTPVAVICPMNPYIMGLSPTPPCSVDSILGWDCPTQMWDPIIDGTECLIVGQGYWMSFSADCCFTPPPPGT